MTKRKETKPVSAGSYVVQAGSPLITNTAKPKWMVKGKWSATKVPWVSFPHLTKR